MNLVRQATGPFPGHGDLPEVTPRRPGDRQHRDPALLSDWQFTDLLAGSLASCVQSGVHADAWCPVAWRADRTFGQTAQAIAVCNRCGQRLECLGTSMREWAAGGRHGIWGGLLESERVRIRAAWQAGAPLAAHAAAAHCVHPRHELSDLDRGPSLWRTGAPPDTETTNVPEAAGAPGNAWVSEAR